MLVMVGGDRDQRIADRMTMKDDYRWDKVLKNGPVKFYTSKICGRQSLKNLK